MRFYTFILMNAPLSGNKGKEMEFEKVKWINQIMEKHEKVLIQYAYSICKNIEMAKDAAQDTFIKLCKEEPSRISGHELPWLLRVCRNRLYDKFKKERKMTFIETEIIERTEDSDPTPSARLQQAETNNQVLAWIDTLPKNQKEVIELKFKTELSYKEIAEVTGLSVSNVGFLLHTAIKTLREKMHNENRLSGMNEGGLQ